MLKTHIITLRRACSRQMGRGVLILAFTAMLGVSPAFAVLPDEVLADPAKESLARSITAELRCPVCQGQSIDDSNAPLARDLRIVVREHVMAGKDKQQILDYVVDRYSEFVLLRPRFSLRNMLLWLGPILLLLAGWALYSRAVGVGASPKPITPVPLTEAEQAKLAKILNQKR